MINSHFEKLEKTISEEPLVISFDLHRNYTSPVTAYIKGEIIFANGTTLALFQHVRLGGDGLFVTDYRYTLHCHNMSFSEVLKLKSK